jgi:hypothetical protein
MFIVNSVVPGAKTPNRNGIREFRSEFRRNLQPRHLLLHEYARYLYWDDATREKHQGGRNKFNNQLITRIRLNDWRLCTAGSQTAIIQ